MQRGTGRRGDHAEVCRETRQRTLALRCEQTLGGQSCAQCLECALQRTGAGGLDFLDDHLVLAACGVQADRAAHEHVLAVARTQACARVAVAEHRAAQLPLFVLQREVPVA